MFPEIPEHGHLLAGDVVRYRHTRQFDDTAFDGIHQGKIAHRPGEQGAFGITGTSEEKRRRREIEDAGYSQFAVDGFKTGDPETCRLIVPFGLFPVVPLQIFFLVLWRFGTVAMMSFVIENEDALHSHQVGHHSLDHLAFRFQRIQCRPLQSLEEHAAAF